MKTSIMTRALRALCALSIVLLTPMLGYAAVLDFDDVAVADPEWEEFLPTNYGGLTWDNMYVIDGAGYAPGLGPDTGVASGANVATNGWGDDASAITSAETFTFSGATFTSSYNDGLTLTLEGYSGNTLVGSTTVVLNTTTQYVMGVTFANIDKLSFSSSGGVDTAPGDFFEGTQFVMDDFRYSKGSAPTGVPELSASGAVSSMALLGGFVAVVQGRRRGHS